MKENHVSLKIKEHLRNFFKGRNVILYRRLLRSMGNVAQPSLGKASGECGLAHRTHAHGYDLLWGIRPALYIGHFETCFLLKLPHLELRQQTFTACL